MQSYVGEITHGLTGTRLYQCWKNMKARCYQESSDRYEQYGMRGIEVCSDWLKFEGFLSWAESSGYKDGLSIDRKDVNGDYNPENCRWLSVEDNTKYMMDYNLQHGLGLFSAESKDKSKLQLIKKLGKPVYACKDGVVISCGSRGELAEVLAPILGRSWASIKTHINLCLRGKCLSCGGYTIYE